MLCKGSLRQTREVLVRVTGYAVVNSVSPNHVHPLPWHLPGAHATVRKCDPRQLSAVQSKHYRPSRYLDGPDVKKKSGHRRSVFFLTPFIKPIGT
jgi:hypothetical protein